jgi:universal stress protein A
MVPSCLQLKHILVPVDFSEPSEKALKYAMKFAEQFGSRITLVHVIQPMVYPAEFGYPPTIVDTLDEAVRRQIEEHLAILARTVGAGTETLVRVGQPYFEIATTAKELVVDLIIITTHRRTGLKHVLLGSTAERVVRHDSCPVLTVREREHDFV